MNDRMFDDVAKELLRKLVQTQYLNPEEIRTLCNYITASEDDIKNLMDRYL